MKCKVCNGTGKISKHFLPDRVRRRKQARDLRKLGFRYLEIMRALGYKSPRSVQLALNRKD